MEVIDIVNIVMSYIAKGMLVLVSLSIYILLVGNVYPMLFMRLRRVFGKSADRGIRKYVFPDGRCVVYEPDMKTRGYINQYELFSLKGTKYIKCKIDPAIRELCYYVLVYDNRDKLVDTLKIYESVRKNGFTRSVKLPHDTSYVNIVLYKVNSECVSKELPVSYSMTNVIAYSLCIVITTVIQAYVSQSLLASLFEGILPIADESIFLPALLFGVILAAVSVGIYYHSITKVNKR